MTRVSALLRASHPAPGAAVTLVVLALAVAVGLSPGLVILVTATMALDQLSVGWSNDWIDAERDRIAGRRDKPVALGQVSRRTVGIAAIVALVLSIAGGFLVSPAAGLAHTVFVLSAWGYNLGLKRTALSFVPYMVSFGLLPAIVTLSLDPPAWPAWWATAAGAGLGLSAHLANVLPDLDDDARTGVRGFPHRLGARPSGVLAFLALVASSLVIAWNAQSVAGIVCFAIIVVVAAYGMSLVLRRRLSRSLFLLILVSALLTVVSLVVAGADLVGFNVMR
ncbi:UbiA family prenyltransferase [Amnibacterium flavum]|uniref:1,4-dihydroxy-2-naphthoate prenyltransferase n=1 Tax=Amnibacterium flavum TaxID=2173173 RepID=A0A2V1HP11_9MICO|nr:UbiA family prenyltransferase [Amnibacterium flavum]PVZ94071.1 1,4-dihydroxy-2-naphthoate prenyltransferase [Amnibacterium flavum]